MDRVNMTCPQDIKDCTMKLTCPTLTCPCRRARGFTHIELLVVMAILFLIVAQMAPAMMQVREVARRSQCQNNLKMIGLALHNYHDVYSLLPPGFVVRNWETSAQQGFGWQVSILPYIDQAPAFNLIRPDGGGLGDAVQDQARQGAMMTRVSEYRCPADITPDKNEFRKGWPTSNYSGNAGYEPFPRLASDVVSQYWPGKLPSPRNGLHLGQRTGLFAVNSAVGFRRITDGTSRTLMVGERGMMSYSGIWVGVTAASNENDQLTDVSHLSRPNRSTRGFSSYHPNSFHALMCDGAVRRIDAAIDSQPNDDPKKPLGVLQRLGGINDGQVVEF
jgi:type II secretory pathway pseudopilin PulG